jgi:hypothetical protein
MVQQYNKQMFLVPSITNTSKEAQRLVIAGFKHFIGYPTNYLIGIDKRIIKVDQGATIAATLLGADGKETTITEKQAFDLNYKRLKEDIAILIK